MDRHRAAVSDFPKMPPSFGSIGNLNLPVLKKSRALKTTVPLPVRTHRSLRYARHETYFSLGIDYSKSCGRILGFCRRARDIMMALIFVHPVVRENDRPINVVVANMVFFCPVRDELRALELLKRRSSFPLPSPDERAKVMFSA